jgi:N-acetylneuraminic acid mutarotase
MAVHNGNLYVFGGFSHTMFNDIKVFNMQENHWRHIKPSKPEQFWPKVRSQFTVDVYEDNLVFFGGQGDNIQNSRTKDCYNNMLWFNTKTQTWRNIEVPNQSPVKKRCGHVSSIMGGMLLVHGGKNTFQKLVLSEFNVYDFLEQDWVPVTVSYGKVNRYQ